MPKTAGFVLQRLTEWGIHRIYGYPGDGINGFLGADRPCVPEVVVDPEIPPVPPHIKKELGKKAAKAMAKGDPENDDRGAHGSFDDQTHSPDPVMWASMHRGALRAGAALGVAGLTGIPRSLRRR